MVRMIIPGSSLFTFAKYEIFIFVKYYLLTELKNIKM